MSEGEMSDEKSYNLKLVLEGALFAAGKPITVEKMGQLFDEQERPTNEAIREALQVIEAECENRSIELKLVASGYRLQVRQSLAPWVNRLWEEKPQRYSRAMLETLALIAYRQPITRGEIEEIRGVSVSSSIVRTLQERDWVRVVGHRDVPGRPAMYATTRLFLDYFNLKNLDELPVLSEIRDLEEMSQNLDLNALTVTGAEGAATAGEAPGEGVAGQESEESVEGLPQKSEVSSLFDGGPQEELEEDEALFRELDEMEKSLPTSFKDLLKGGVDSGQPEAENEDESENENRLSVAARTDDDTVTDAAAEKSD
ncbi:SMC-Scp complex subunit ScpB [Aestuariirhabdus sp. LZHN29]|uniref:SMC-Scp complex subunit ScpB n=1 Tax=Aestuariirhabdus sp. LZHN29 TaxID=3417462 RepID=UPI003CE75321